MRYTGAPSIAARQERRLKPATMLSTPPDRDPLCRVGSWRNTEKCGAGIEPDIHRIADLRYTVSSTPTLRVKARTKLDAALLFV